MSPCSLFSACDGCKTIGVQHLSISKELLHLLYPVNKSGPSPLLHSYMKDRNNIKNWMKEDGEELFGFSFLVFI